MSTRSIKFRLISWYAGWLALVFLGFGMVVYKSLEYYLERASRQALETRTRNVASVLKSSTLNWAELGREVQVRFAPEANNRFTRLTEQGRVHYVSGSPADGSFEPAAVPVARPSAEPYFERRRLPDGTLLLVATRPVVVRERPVLIEEGYSNAGILATLHGWAFALGGGLILLIGATMLGGLFVVDRALRPVDTIIRAAERISSRNLSERLPVPLSGDELERLSTALNQMIQRLEESFRHTQRFLADASHELRTPLTILQVELEGMLESIKEREAHDLAGSALEEVERLRNIVEGLFALSRMDAGEALQKLEPFDLGKLVSDTTEQMSVLADDKGIAITCDAGQRLMINADRARLKQVTLNLLDNAIKYTSSGGRVDVKVGIRAERAVLEVADSGIGIPETALPHVFERFYRVDKARSRLLGGAGLGLAIVKSICVAHAGQVQVRSKEGQGSCFTVELPLRG